MDSLSPDLWRCEEVRLGSPPVDFQNGGGGRLMTLWRGVMERAW